MIKVEVRMNLDKVKEVGEYEPERVLKAVDNAYMQYGFRKEVLDDGTVCFWGNNHSDDFGYFGALILALKDTDWFMKYVDKWYWYNNSCMPYEDWFRQEDILKELGLGKSA